MKKAYSAVHLSFILWAADMCIQATAAHNLSRTACLLVRACIWRACSCHTSAVSDQNLWPPRPDIVPVHSQTTPSRILVLTCRSGLEGAGFNLGDPNFKSRRYDSGIAYQQAKLALAYFAFELDLR